MVPDSCVKVQVGLWQRFTPQSRMSNQVAHAQLITCNQACPIVLASHGLQGCTAAGACERWHRYACGAFIWPLPYSFRPSRPSAHHTQAIWSTVAQRLTVDSNFDYCRPKGDNIKPICEVGEKLAVMRAFSDEP